MSKTFYMHTLNGKPAGFFDGKGVCYASSVNLCSSLRQLRREQKTSKRNYHRAQWFVYGYKRVKVQP